MSLATAVFFVALLAHSWVGVRDVIMDYVHPVALRLGLLTVLAFSLTATALWVAQSSVDGTRGARHLSSKPQQTTMQLSIFRYNPERDKKPYMQDFEIDLGPADRMLLDVILRLKARDDSLTIRKSCREGVCGSDAININGRNGLACITPVRELKEPVELRPLPSFPVIRDLVVDMTQFFHHYHSIKPYLINDEASARKGTPAVTGRPRQAEWPVRVHLVCVLHQPVPTVVVEPRQICWPGRPAAGVPLHHRQPRSSDPGTAG